MYTFIKIKGSDGANTGYFVPNMYKLSLSWLEQLKYFGRKLTFLFTKDRLAGWTIWWVDSEENLKKAVETLNELKKTRIFDFKILDIS